jgi:tryptophan-rich sensory protein
MKSDDKNLIMALFRGLPFVLLAVGFQTLGALLLVFVPAIVFPDQKRVTSFLMIPYFCWSTWRMLKYFAKLSESVGRTNQVKQSLNG